MSDLFAEFEIIIVDGFPYPIIEETTAGEVIDDAGGEDGAVLTFYRGHQLYLLHGDDVILEHVGPGTAFGLDGWPVPFVGFDEDHASGSRRT